MVILTFQHIAFGNEGYSVNKLHFWFGNLIRGEFYVFFSCEACEWVVSAKVIIDIRWLENIWILLGTSSGLLNYLVCCCYQSFLWGYFVDDKKKTKQLKTLGSEHILHSINDHIYFYM